MTSQVSFAGQETDWTYNSVGETLASTLVAASGSGLSNETTTNTWDALGRELTTSTAAGTTTMGYNLTGQMTSLEDRDSNTTSWQVDTWGRPISQTSPAGYTETFGYDANSNLTQQVDFNGQTRQFVFDDLNQETAEKWVSGSSVLNTISTAYNADGQVVSTGDNYSDYAFGYDGQGNATSVDNSGTPGAPHVVLTSQYNAQGERTSLAATIAGTADFINSYSYTALGQLDQVQQQGQTGGNAVASKTVYLGLDAIGDITEIDYANSVTDGPYESGPGYATLSYSSTTGQLTGINDLHDGTSIDNLTYGYDGLGRISTFSSIDGTASYGYDNTSQLVSASYTTASGGHQPANVSFSWDANGNNNATGVTVSHNEVTNDGTFTYTFDHNGNRTSRQRISSASASDYLVTFSWDYRNRLTDVEFFNNSDVLTKHVHYVYDIYNNLIEEDIDPTGGGSYTTVEQFALDVHPQLPVQVLSLSGTIDPSAPDDTLLEFVDGELAERFLSATSPSGADVIYAQGAVSSLTVDDVVDWLFVNNQGSPTDVVNSSGALINHQVYSPFGQLVYASNSGVFVFQGFSGGIADPNTGFIKFGELWYDPTTGGWPSQNPAGFAAGDNPYRYAGNSPTGGINRTGPSSSGPLASGASTAETPAGGSRSTVPNNASSTAHPTTTVAYAQANPQARRPRANSLPPYIRRQVQINLGEPWSIATPPGVRRRLDPRSDAGMSFYEEMRRAAERYPFPGFRDQPDDNYWTWYLGGGGYGGRGVEPFFVGGRQYNGDPRGIPTTPPNETRPGGDEIKTDTKPKPCKE